ncbi:MAG: four helix bundle protein [Anaerolineaceae bacterium 4572_5.1]|nr:MAG: four helix bundle protein [Anaerolineaceae bacterium 4572_5.1]
MSTITRFEEIKAWKTARELTNQVYDFTDSGEFSRDYGLKDQIRRAAVSVMSNIAEGFESQTQAMFISYLGRAKASAGEVRSQLYIALDQKYITEEQFKDVYDIVDKASRQIYRFIVYLESQPNSRRVSENTVEYRI